MVDDEGTVGAGHRQRLPDQAVCLLDALAERVIASLVVCFVPFVEYGERLECISGYDRSNIRCWSVCRKRSDIAGLSLSNSLCM